MPIPVIHSGQRVTSRTQARARPTWLWIGAACGTVCPLFQFDRGRLGLRMRRWSISFVCMPWLPRHGLWSLPLGVHILCRQRWAPPSIVIAIRKFPACIELDRLLLGIALPKLLLTIIAVWITSYSLCLVRILSTSILNWPQMTLHRSFLLLKLPMRLIFLFLAFESVLTILILVEISLDLIHHLRIIAICLI